MKEEEEEEEVEPITKELTKAPVKSEINGETPKPILASTLIRCSRSNGCGRSRQNLSEVYDYYKAKSFVYHISFFVTLELTFANTNL